MLDYRERKELREYLAGKRLNRRLLVVRLLFIAAFAGCLGGLYYLQLLHGAHYRQMADSNRLRREFIRPLRGDMRDRNGRQLVANRTAFTVVLDREQGHDAERIVKQLAPILGLEADTLRERIGRYATRPSFEPAILKEDVSLAEIAWLEARRYEYPEILIPAESVRYYPDGTAIAHAVGYVGEASENQLAADESLALATQVGKAGLERVYDRRLRGRLGIELVEVNSVGRPLGPVYVTRPPEPGDGLFLSLDMKLQRTLVDAFGDEVGAGVFLDPRNGEILALASMPSFNPNLFAYRFSPDEWREIRTDPKHPLLNRAVSSKYSPGSTFKLVVAVGALEDGIVNGGTKITCTGGAYFYKRRFGCWKKGGHGPVNLHEALVGSCNVFFYTVGQKLGIDRIAHYARAMGFGDRTGLDLVGERAGTVPSPQWKMQTRREKWYPGETISVSIGQGPMEVTVMQMVNMAAGIANGGRIYAPKMIRPGYRRPVERSLHRHFVVSPKTLEVIRTAMYGVVNESGTGGRARMKDVAVAGKTGTVQVYKASAGIDSADLPKEMRDHAWFVGFAPYDNPEIAFAVFVEHGGHGGSISAPIVKKVLEVYFGGTGKPGLGNEPALPPLEVEPQLTERATPTR